MATRSRYLTTDTCITCSSPEEPSKAIGFNRNRLSIQRYYENVENQWSKYNMPPLEYTQKWRVYRFPSEVYPHCSLYFETQAPQYKNSPGFNFWLKIARRGAVIPVTSLANISTDIKQEFPCIGTIHDTAENIMDTGLKCLEEFGNYDYYSSNCEHFCNMLADALLGKKKPKEKTKKESEGEWTTGQTMVAAAAVAGIGLLGALLAGAALTESPEAKEKEKKKNSKNY